MEMMHARIEIGDSSAVGETRRVAHDLARQIDLGQTAAGRLSVVVTEAAANVMKHAGGGEILLRTYNDQGIGIDMLALDRGPGILEIASALRDGYSSAGTPGNGLGAIVRLASRFDLFTQPGKGTALYARVAGESGPSQAGVPVGVAKVAHPGESVCGDDWDVATVPGRTLAIVADGLGHGIEAHTAARLATEVFRGHLSSTPAELLQRIHQSLRPTRGAAVAIAELEPERQLLRFAGIGNIAGTILHNGTSRSVVSQHGTAGHHARKIQEFTYPWLRQSRLVLHSDGLTTHWTVDAYPGLLDRDPMLVAGVLYRDFWRHRDDVTVLVLQG